MLFRLLLLLLNFGKFWIVILLLNWLFFLCALLLQLWFVERDAKSIGFASTKSISLSESACKSGHGAVVIGVLRHIWILRSVLAIGRLIVDRSA